MKRRDFLTGLAATPIGAKAGLLAGTATVTTAGALEALAVAAHAQMLEKLFEDVITYGTGVGVAKIGPDGSPIQVTLSGPEGFYNV